MIKKLKLSRFDLGIIIAFVVVTLAGAGAWWYLSGALSDAQTEVDAAKADFDKYSSNPEYNVVVSSTNAKTLATNIELIKSQLVPLVGSIFKSKDNKLSLIRQEDPIAWKHDLDDQVHRLTTVAKNHNVAIPPNYYFGFSRYLNQNPGDEQTVVLSKQLLAVDQLTGILIGASVKSIDAIRRTYEEDPRPTQGGGSGAPATGEGDHLPGYSMTAAGGAYTAYPFEIQFQSDTENYRTVLNGLIQSPYIFVVRSVTVKNSAPTSPAPTDLDRMAGTPPSSVVATSPGEVAATTSTVGPQYLFGNSTITVTARVDMIEWLADPSGLAPSAGGKAGSGKKGGI